MSSNSRITRSKGPSDGTSLPPYTRPRKDASTKAGNAGSLQPPTQQQTVCDPLNSTVGHSPFARPGSRAGASTAPATPTGMLSVSASPFARPGSRAGSPRSEVDFPSAAPQAARSSSCNSMISSMGDVVFPPNVNTLTSWEVIDPACDEEVAGITNGQSQHHANRPAHVNADSNSSNQGIGVDQVSDINSTNNLGTLYNQDFFVADMTNRRLSQIPNKTNYPYPLPNGHTALQLRLPDLLIYLKTDTYLMDVNTGEHYAVYTDKIQKMSVTPKLYAAWGYNQLLHTIQSDALQFGVNSPQPLTSGVSQKASPKASPASHCPQPPASLCRPTIVKYEPPTFSLETPTWMLTRDEWNQVLQNHVVAVNAIFNKVAVFETLIQREPHNALYYEEVWRVRKNQHIHVAIKLQHILETDDNFQKAAGLPQLDLPEHLWGVRDMRSAHTREQDFMAIMAEVEVLCQQLKGRGTYTVSPTTPTTCSSKSGGSVHFQPIDPAQKSSVQAMDQSLLNSSLNLLDDSPRMPLPSSNGPIPHGQATPQIPAHRSNYPILPTPYVNQTTVDQHKRAQPTPFLPRMTLGSINVQSPKQVQSPQLPDSVQLQRLPFVDAPLAPARNHQTDHTGSPSMLETTSKSVKGQGVKQSSSGPSSASTSMGKSGPVCWNCQEVGHRRHNFKNPSYCSKCKQSGHLPMKCPLKGKKTEKSQTQQNGQQMTVDPMFSNVRNKCIHCGGDHAPGSCPTKTGPQATQKGAGYQTYDYGAATGKAKANNLPSFSS